MRVKAYAVSVCLSIALAANCAAGGKVSITTIEQAIEIVSKPRGGILNMSPFELQVYCRLKCLLYQGNYKCELEHFDAWLKCMQDKKQSMYGRLCAAYFLLDKYEEARAFVLSQLKSKNLRYRYNAAKVVEFHVGRNPDKKWGMDILIQLLSDGSIDGSGVRSSPPGDYPQGDRDDIMETPIDSICWDMGFMKEKKAVPALISVLERRPSMEGAAFALGEIGDKRAIPILMKVLKDRSGHESREVTALGQLKCKEAVPILISRLGARKSTSSGTDVFETEPILEALLAIGDKRAIEPIEKYLQGDYPRGSKAVARRVLIQLKSPDPVKALLALLEKETYEPERSNIIYALVKHPDRRVVERLEKIARSSNSAFMRREAIFGLEEIADQRSLLALASLLDVEFSRNLKAEWGWKVKPDFRKYFPETIEMCLKQTTKQDFGKDRRKWEDWIKKNVEPEAVLDKK